MTLALAAAGCEPRESIRLHYLPGFVPGSRAVFWPAKIAIPPARGEKASGQVTLGGIFAPSGAVRKRLKISDPGKTVTAAIVNAVADSGLVPVAIDSIPADSAPPPGADFILISELEQVEVN
ncbi:MAG TPA: hypothetical protein VIX12_07490, partial [Candidatus Binataceae bacterium]